MSLTFAQLRQAVYDNTGRTDKQSTVDRGINLAIETIGKMHFFRQQHKIQSIGVNTDDQSFDTNTDFFQARGVTLLLGTLSNNLELLSWIEGTRLYPNISALGSGRPGIAWFDYSFSPTKVMFAPKASQSYNFQLDYYRLIPSLVSDSDTILVPFIDEAVIAYATNYLFKAVENFSSASAWAQNFTLAYGMARDSDQKEPGISYTAQPHGSGVNTGTVDPWLDPFVRSTH